MKTQRCRECGAQIIMSAKTCPQCGVKQKQVDFVFKVFLAFGVFFIMLQLYEKRGELFPLDQSPAKSSLVVEGWELIRMLRMDALVVIDKEKETDVGVYQKAARALCVPGKHCFISFWSDRRYVPSSFPMTDEQVDAQIASYTKNPTTGYDKLLWNCRIKNDLDNCFR